jgi:hypothetical protein
MDVHPTKNGISRYWSIPILLRANRILGNYKKVSAITDYHSIPIQIRVSLFEIQLSTHASFPKHGSSMNYTMHSTHTSALLIMEFLDSSLHRIIYSRPSAYRLPSVVPLQIDTSHSYPIFINFELFHVISASVSANYIHVSYWSVVQMCCIDLFRLACLMASSGTVPSVF